MLQYFSLASSSLSTVESCWGSCVTLTLSLELVTDWVCYETNLYFISEGEISFLNFQSPYVLELPEIITSHAPSTVYTSQTHAIRC